MSAHARAGVLAVVGLIAAIGFAGPAAAGADDVNAVFAPMRELPRAVLDHANGKGIGDLKQQATLTVNGVESPDVSAQLQGLHSVSGGFTGNNSIAAGAFTDSQVFAAIVQNNGSYVNIQNMMAVEVNMLP